MKVLNEEVEDCCLCPYLGSYSMNEEPCCKLDKKDIEDINVIPEHCPFNKPVTKEVIEGFGFLEIPKLSPKHCDIYRREDNLQIMVGKNIVEINTYYEYESTLFKGTINNPVELEFILRSIGVIE